MKVTTWSKLPNEDKGQENHLKDSENYSEQALILLEAQNTYTHLWTFLYVKLERTHTNFTSEAKELQHGSHKQNRAREALSC